MKFTKSKKSGNNQKKVVFLFFQAPSKTVLSKIKEYLHNNNFNNTGYFGKELGTGIMQHSGHLSDFPEHVNNHSFKEIIIIGNPARGEVSQEFLLALKFSGAIIKLIPIDFNLLTGLVKINNLNDLPHIRLYPDSISIPDKIAKTILNKLTAVIGLSLTAALFPFIALLIKSTSKGPVIYSQKRLGKSARPFMLYKFRTMYVSAEEGGPQLSHATDKRITKAGKILRYWHIDELPQFWNILKGDMALVGPRPERAYFAKYLSDRIPYYKIIYQEKPGLTSLGMVKYGYASSVEEMTDRLYYDIVYLNNPSFFIDLKIIGNTLWYIVLKAFYDPSVKRRQYMEEQLDSVKENHDPLVRWLSLKDLARM